MRWVRGAFICGWQGRGWKGEQIYEELGFFLCFFPLRGCWNGRALVLFFYEFSCLRFCV